MFLERFFSYLIVAIELLCNIGRILEYAAGLLQTIKRYLDDAIAKSPN